MDIHNIEFLNELRSAVAAKMAIPGLNRKWLVIYAAFVAVIDRLIKVLTPATPA